MTYKTEVVVPVSKMKPGLLCHMIVITVGQAKDPIVLPCLRMMVPSEILVLICIHEP